MVEIIAKKDEDMKYIIIIALAEGGSKQTFRKKNEKRRKHLNYIVKFDVTTILDN